MCSFPQADAPCPLILDLSAEGFRNILFPISFSRWVTIKLSSPVYTESITPVASPDTFLLQLIVYSLLWDINNEPLTRRITPGDLNLIITFANHTVLVPFKILYMNIAPGIFMLYLALQIANGRYYTRI
jgi:hypothetical protein